MPTVTKCYACEQKTPGRGYPIQANRGEKVYHYGTKTTILDVEVVNILPGLSGGPEWYR